LRYFTVAIAMNKFYLLPVLFALLSSDPVVTTPDLEVLVKKPYESGTYTAYHENGNKKFVVVQKKNKLTGEWRSWYPTGMACDSGRFAGSIPDGEWKGWYPDGSLRYKWHLSSAKLNALKDELLRQPKMKMFAISQKPVSEAVKYYQADHLFDQPTSKPRIAFRAQLVHSKSYDINSIEKKVDKNTTSNSGYVPPFPEMLLHGEYASFYPGGKIKEEGIYINGLREGVWEEHTPEGQKIRGTYYHGYKSGEWRKYDSDGKLISYTRYKSNGDISEEHKFSSER
jgi:antitoxin component YwqK of YwqJK toxin-antitoxin module